MPRYKVRGLKAGQPVRLTVVANNLTEARARLRREGIFAKPEDIQEEKPFFSLDTSFDFSMLGSIDIRDKAVFSRQFAASSTPACRWCALSPSWRSRLATPSSKNT
jgi:type IV pilus assembly protein PilC